MRVLFDHQIFWLQKYGGISRYYAGLIQRLNHVDDVSPALSLWYSDNQHLASSTLVKDGIAPAKPLLYDAVRWGQSITKKDLMGFFDQRTSLKALRKHDFDIFHPTYYYPYFLDHLQGTPFVLTVYDMTHEIMSDFFRDDDPTAMNKKRLAEGAERIIAISQSTKNDLVRICGIEPSKITVVHLASSLKASQAVPVMPAGVPDDYLLFTGKRDGYKNFLPFVKTAAGIVKKDPKLHIVCGGGGPFTESELRSLKDLGISDKVIQVGVDDATLMALYGGARAFVFPSLYEGFGIPILEAFECGCPVIATDRSSFPEVVGDAGLLFDPQEPDSLRNAISNVLENESLRASLIEKGRKRAELFPWDRTVKETVEIYRGIR